jgi:hypothetical protein
VPDLPADSPAGWDPPSPESGSRRLLWITLAMIALAAAFALFAVLNRG